MLTPEHNGHRLIAFVLSYCQDSGSSSFAGHLANCTVSSTQRHNKRQVTQHGCLPSLLGDGDKGIEILYGEEKNTLS
jgi:hypothetical protein